MRYQGQQIIGHGHPRMQPVRSRVNKTTTANSPLKECTGNKGSKALECATATTGETSVQTPIASSTVALDVVQNTPKSIAAELEEIVTPVNAQHLNDWLTGYDPDTRGHLHIGFTKRFYINCRAAAGALQQEGGCETIDLPLRNPTSSTKLSRKR